MKVVPWISLREWKDVQTKIVSNSPEDWVKAYNDLLMWKARCQNLPANVECTLGIIQVLVFKIWTQENPASDQNVLLSKEAVLQQSFSTAIVRFVNHLSATTSMQGDTLYLAASKQNIPDWIINLRHDVSHNSTLPPISLLESAVLLAKTWLVENYWEIQEPLMTPVFGEHMIEQTCKTLTLEKLVKTLIRSWWACQRLLDKNDSPTLQLSKENWDDINMIRNHSLLIINNIEFLKLNTIVKTAKSSSSGRVEVKALKIKLAAILTEVSSKRDEAHEWILEGVIDSGILKCENDEFRLWKRVLKLLYTRDSLSSFMEYLLQQVDNGSENEAHAIAWLQYLLPSLESVHSQRVDTSLKVEFKKCDSIFKDVPRKQPLKISQDVLRPILLRLTPEIVEIITRLLCFVHPDLPKPARELLKNLMHLYTADVLVDPQLVDNSDDLMDVDLTADKSRDVIKPMNGIWRKVNFTENDATLWRQCPLGLVPHEMEPNFDLSSVTWELSTTK